MKQKIKKQIFLFLLISMMGGNLLAQLSTQGTDFWVSFGSRYNTTVPQPYPILGNILDRPIIYEIEIITGAQAATIHFYFTDNHSTDSTFTIPANTVKSIQLSAPKRVAVYNNVYTGSSLKSLNITSDVPVAVYALDQFTASTDASNIMPSNSWGQNYYLLSYQAFDPGRDGYIVIAKEANTQVYENSILVATLGVGGVYQKKGAAGSDLTGLHITADKPIALFESNSGARVPHSARYSDIFFQQEPPISQWGKEYAVPNTIQKVGRVRVMAACDGANITQTGAVLPTSNPGGQRPANANAFSLNAGQWVELEISGENGCYIASDKQIGVCAYMVCESYSQSPNLGDIDNTATPNRNQHGGDPSISWIPPIDQLLPSISMSPFFALNDVYLKHHYALIITPTATCLQTLVSEGGNALETLSEVTWRAIGTSGYSFATYGELSNITYRFENPAGLIVGGYGVGSVESYYYVGGAGIYDLSADLLINGESYKAFNSITACPANINFEAILETCLPLQQPPGSIRWILDDSELNNREDIAIWSGNLPEGDHKIELKVRFDIDGIVKESSYISHFTVLESEGCTPCPPRAVWTGAIDNDWQNPGNWICIDENKVVIANVIPQSCTDVWIPGNLTNYPILKNEANECDDIYFMMGGEMAQQQYLSYTRAHTQLNFGLQNQTIPNPANLQDIAWESAGEGSFTSSHLAFSAGKSGNELERNRWYMLSSALQDAISGDFAFGDYPRVFMRKFDFITPTGGSTPVGQWTKTFANEVSPLTPMEGYSVWVNQYADIYGYRETGSGDAIISGKPYGLQQQNGIIEFPFYENGEMSAARRIHNRSGNTSDFYYIWKTGSNAEEIDRTEKDSYPHGAYNQAYRFIGETYNGTKWVQTPTPLTYLIPSEIFTDGGEILVGNPYMSSIDFVTFLKDNKNVINNHYRLWDGNTFFTATVDDPDAASPNITIVGNPGGTTAGYIPPLQSFFVTVKAAANRLGNTISFDVTKNVVQPAPVGAPRLRSHEASMEKNSIRIQAQNNEFNSETLIGKRENANNGYKASEDVYKIFSQKLNVPEIYTIADNYALVMNFIQGQGELTIPLGLKTNLLSQTKLILTGMNHYQASSIEFIDMAANQTIDITNTDRYEYNFNNRTQGVNEGQFYLRIQHSPTGITPPESDKLRIYRTMEGINVVSVSTDQIKQISIYDLRGRKLYHNASVNQDLYTVQDRWQGEKMLIVKVITGQNALSMKVINQINKKTS
jgi:hypothetical protein